jgi:hypothetical protein
MAWSGYDPLWGNLIHWLAGQVRFADLTVP